MNIKLIASIESFGDAGYIGYIDSIKGMVVQGSTIKETWQELLISIKVKMAYDWGIDIANIEEKEFSSLEKSRLTEFEGKDNSKQELNFTIA